jgi:hypothetical protein
MNYDEWLGELAFTIRCRSLNEGSGVPFDMPWHALPFWEKRSWIETAKAIHEVGANSVRDKISR